MFDNFTLLFLVESRLKTVALETTLNENTFIFYNWNISTYKLAGAIKFTPSQGILIIKYNLSRRGC